MCGGIGFATPGRVNDFGRRLPAQRIASLRTLERDYESRTVALSLKGSIGHD